MTGPGTTGPGGRDGAAGGARSAVRDLIEQTAVQSFGAVVRREPLEGSVVLTRSVLDEALAGVRAARLVADLAVERLREYGLAARAAGRCWDEVADALGLVDDEDDPAGVAAGVAGGVRAETAFEWLVEQRAPDTRRARFGWRPEAWWRCRDCGVRVLDRGPFESHPEDREQGHAPGCARHRAAVRAWRREHDPVEQDEHDDEHDQVQDQVQDEWGPGGGRR